MLQLFFISSSVCSIADQARMRLAASKGLLKLAGNPTYFPYISPKTFTLMSQTLQDSCVEVRSQFAAKLNQYLMRGKLPVSYLSFFTLSAIDPEKECRRAVWLRFQCFWATKF